MASSNDFVKSNCCVLCDDRHHFRSLREKYVRKERSMLIALAAARTGSGHLVVELVMPFVAGRRLGDAPFYAY